MHYKIGSRGSRLALVQTTLVKNRLAEHYPEDDFEIVVLSSRGDRDQSSPLEKLGAGAFVRDLEERLLADEVDLLVHSMKDLPAEEPQGLILSKAWARADPRDALVDREGRTLDQLPRGAIVATGSVRRTHFLRQRRPDLRFVPIRGNVDTRLKKLHSDPIDALVLACAGLDRLGLCDVISERFDPEWMIPAPNQGQLAIELRATDLELKTKLDAIGDDSAERIAVAEREFLRRTGATCRDAVAAYATISNGEMKLRSFFRKTTLPKVTLVGAGPGDPGLITVKGLAAIRAAEAIVYDRLVNQELLREVGDNCELYYAGKRCGEHSMSQDAINDLLVKLTTRYAKVVRLKGGDSFVFGRGGEELAFLQERGIECEVIPGVTSAIAVPATVGIPLTHRGAATSFRVITAHGADFTAEELDYASMRDPKLTLVFMMGFAALREIAAKLIEAGRSPFTPAAVIASGTTDAQNEIRGPLVSIADAASELSAPSILVVGDVVEFGRRCLVAKVGDAESRLATRLRAAGALVTEVTVGRIRPLSEAVTPERFACADWLIITSVNALEVVKDMIAALTCKPKVAAIGPTTAAAAERMGLPVALVSSVANSSVLLAELSPFLSPKDIVLRLMPKGIEDSLAALATRCSYEAVAVYINESVEYGPIDYADFDEIYYTSTSCKNRLQSPCSVLGAGL